VQPAAAVVVVVAAVVVVLVVAAVVVVLVVAEVVVVLVVAEVVVVLVLEAVVVVVSPPGQLPGHTQLRRHPPSYQPQPLQLSQHIGTSVPYQSHVPQSQPPPLVVVVDVVAAVVVVVAAVVVVVAAVVVVVAAVVVVLLPSRVMVQFELSPQIAVLGLQFVTVPLRTWVFQLSWMAMPCERQSAMLTLLTVQSWLPETLKNPRPQLRA